MYFFLYKIIDKYYVEINSFIKSGFSSLKFDKAFQFKSL